MLPVCIIFVRILRVSSWILPVCICSVWACLGPSGSFLSGSCLLGLSGSCLSGLFLRALPASCLDPISQDSLGLEVARLNPVWIYLASFCVRLSMTRIVSHMCVCVSFRMFSVFNMLNTWGCLSTYSQSASLLCEFCLSGSCLCGSCQFASSLSEPVWIHLDPVCLGLVCLSLAGSICIRPGPVCLDLSSFSLPASCLDPTSLASFCLEVVRLSPVCPSLFRFFLCEHVSDSHCFMPIFACYRS